MGNTIHTLRLEGDITPEAARTLVDAIECRAPTETIVVEITSRGGDTLSALMIRGALEKRKRQFPGVTNTLGRELVASSALLVFLSGERRIITPKTCIQLHAGQNVLDGRYSAEALLRKAAQVQRLDAMYVRIFFDRTLKILSRSEILNAMKRDTLLDARTALRLGIASEIMS